MNKIKNWSVRNNSKKKKKNGFLEFSSNLSLGHFFGKVVLLLGELDDEVIEEFFLDLESSLSGVFSDERGRFLIGLGSLDVSDLSGSVVGSKDFSDFSNNI